MSELQISLLIIGAAVIVAVFIFNLVQERRFRRSLGDSFKTEREDVLLKARADDDNKVEPQFQQEPAAEFPSRTAATRRHTADASVFDESIDYVAVINAQAPIVERDMVDFLARMAAIGRPYRAMAFNAGTGCWEDLARGGGSRCTSLRVALQLVNRSGSVTAAQLAMFGDAVRNFAAAHGAEVICPDAGEALNAARELNAFCGEVDITIGINVIAPDGRAFAGGRIRALAEEAGFSLEPDGVFRLRDARLRTLFTLDNHEPAPFIPEQIGTLATSGVTLLLDVPLVEDGVAVFDRMFEMGTRFSALLGGELVDDNRVALSASGAAAIRRQLGTIHAKMHARGIDPGGALAMRLFS